MFVDVLLPKLSPLLRKTWQAWLEKEADSARAQGVAVLHFCALNGVSAHDSHNWTLGQWKLWVELTARDIFAYEDLADKHLPT